MHFKEYKTILSPKNGMNIYRGCSHGCIYCDSRSTCYSMDHAFTDVEVKKDAYKILDYELSMKKKSIMIGTGSMTDPYCSIEEELGYTRKCLEVILKHECGVTIITKSTRILRDLDLLVEINKKTKVVVQMTLTTYDDTLCKIVEPNVSVTSERVECLKKLHEAGIPTIVWLCPILPFINDTKENLIGLLEYCSSAHVYGILYFGFGLTLREGNREYFYQKLDMYFPGLKEKYIKTYGNQYNCASHNEEYLHKILVEECKERGILLDNDAIFHYLNTMPEKYNQISLFDLDNR